MGLPVHRHLTLLHGLQQRRLGPGGGPVQLIGQKQVAEDGALLIFHGPGPLVIDGETRHVRGHHVRGELHPLVVQLQCSGESQGQGGLAYAGLVLQQKMASRQHGQEGFQNHIVLANDGPADFIQHLFRVIHGNPSFQHRFKLIIS